jgi:NADPH:quinone reductase
VQLVDRQRIKVLPGQQRQRVVGLVGEEFIEVHALSVDPRRPAVNNTDTASFRPEGKLMAETDGTIPADMAAIDPEQPGGPEMLVAVRRPIPAPGPGEVLIRVAAAGVNRPDVLQRRGLYPPPPGAPTIPGLEVAGTIRAIGQGVATWQPGQQVCALVGGGGYAEYAVAPAGQCLPVPAALTMVEAAAMPETLFTVWINLFERAYARDGEVALVHGGTSGIGTMAIALGRLFGVTMIVTCGSDDKCARAEALGAAKAINYRDGDFVEAAKAFTGGRGVDLVLDMVGGDYLPRNLDCLAEDGRHVSIAVQRGATAEINIARVMQRRLTLTGSTLRPRSVEFKSLVAEELARTVWPHVERGALKPVIDTCFPLNEAAAAHRRMEAGDHVGKIVLTT